MSEPMECRWCGAPLTRVVEAADGSEFCPPGYGGHEHSPGEARTPAEPAQEGEQ